MRHVVCIAVLLFCSGSIYAQSCGTIFSRPVSSHSSSYSIPHSYIVPSRHVEKVIINKVLTPVAVPVLVPTTVFQYLPALQPVPLVTSAPVVTAPVAASRPPVANAAQLTADIDRIVRERVEAVLREKFGASDEPPPLLGTGERPVPADNDADIDQKAAQILGNNCASCHTTGVKTAGNVSLFKKDGEDLIFEPSESKSSILAQITPSAPGVAPAMPPSAKTKPETAIRGDEFKLLQRWAKKP